MRKAGNHLYLSSFLYPSENLKFAARDFRCTRRLSVAKKITVERERDKVVAISGEIVGKFFTFLTIGGWSFCAWVEFFKRNCQNCQQFFVRKYVNFGHEGKGQGTITTNFNHAIIWQSMKQLRVDSRNPSLANFLEYNFWPFVRKCARRLCIPHCCAITQAAVKNAAEKAKAKARSSSTSSSSKLLQLDLAFYESRRNVDRVTAEASIHSILQTPVIC